MRLVLVDDDGRVLSNAAVFAADPHVNCFTYKEAESLESAHIAEVADLPESMVRDIQTHAKFKVAVSFLGKAGLSEALKALEERWVKEQSVWNLEGDDSVENTPRPELADCLASAIENIDSACELIKDDSPSAADDLAEVGNNIQRIKAVMASGGAGARSTVEQGNERPQPIGFERTFIRQRPKETWVDTALRVFGEDGMGSLEELFYVNPALAEDVVQKLSSLYEQIEFAQDGQLSIVSQRGRSPTRITHGRSDQRMKVQSPSLRPDLSKRKVNEDQKPGDVLKPTLSVNARAYVPKSVQTPRQASPEIEVASVYSANQASTTAYQHPLYPGNQSTQQLDLQLRPITPWGMLPVQNVMHQVPHHYTSIPPMYPPVSNPTPAIRPPPGFELPCPIPTKVVITAPPKPAVPSTALKTSAGNTQCQTGRATKASVDFVSKSVSSENDGVVSSKKLSPVKGKLSQSISGEADKTEDVEVKTRGAREVSLSPSPQPSLSSSLSAPFTSSRPQTADSTNEASSVAAAEICGTDQPTSRTWAQTAALTHGRVKSGRFPVVTKSAPYAAVHFCPLTKEPLGRWCRITGLPKKMQLVQVTSLARIGSLVAAKIDSPFDPNSCRTADLLFLHNKHVDQLITDSPFGTGVSIHKDGWYVGSYDLTAMLRDYDTPSRRLILSGAGQHAMASRIEKFVQTTGHGSVIERANVYNSGSMEIVLTNVWTAEILLGLINKDKKQLAGIRASFAKERGVKQQC